MQPLPFFLGLALVGTVAAAAKNRIPNYIDICKRNDPHLEDCILKSVEKLRPKLKTGIPELDVPGLEPLILPEVDVSRGAGVRAKGTNVTVRGASNFRVLKLKADLKNTTFYVKLMIPALTFNAQYDVNARILVLPLKGHGQIKANAKTRAKEARNKAKRVATLCKECPNQPNPSSIMFICDVMGDVILKGRKVKRDGDTYIDFSEIKLSLDISNYSVHLDNLFNGNKELGKAVNNALNMNKREFMDALRPVVERVVSNVLLEIAKNITKNFTYNELFPL